MIPNELVQTIKDAARIEEIIAESITLKRSGPNFIGKCPFHEENTESFTVSPAKGIYKCFGCGKGGDAVHFVQEYENVSYPAALKLVAKRYTIDFPERELTESELADFKKREASLLFLKRQNDSFVSSLSKNQQAIDWLTVVRGILPATIEKWGIGYSTSGFWSGRITYPIKNGAGEICGFTGRRLNDELQPKFKNSPESDLFKKSELLFGLHHAKKMISKADKAYLVEGQHDVLQMDQIGFGNTVAPSGTSITVHQIRAIKRFTNNIVLLLDGDSAGIKAAIKTITPLLSEQINLRIIVLPEKEDPDSFIRNSEPGQAKEYIQNSEINFIEFKALQYRDDIEKDPTRKGELLDGITNDISIIEDKNIRLAYIQKCSSIFGIKENELLKDIRGLRGKMAIPTEEGKWFAFEEAAAEIREKKQVLLFSKFETVITNHLNDVRNCLGMSCAIIQQNEILKLKKLTKIVVFDEFVVDGFDKIYKKETPIVYNIKRLISFQLDVRMREGTEICYDKDSGIPYEIRYINFTDWYINKITDLLSQADDVFTSYAIEQIAELLSYLPESTRMTKLSTVQSMFKQRGVKLIIGDFKKILSTFLRKNAKTYEPDFELEISPGDNPLNLTQEQLKDLNRYSHFFRDNAMHHYSKTGHVAKISNFIITPIIHSNTSSGHFKLFEMINEFGLKVNISLDTKDLNDLRRFKCAVEEKGNFIFKGQQNELDDIKERLYSHTTYSNEIEQLGWQSEGFWAWADGVTTTDGIFTETDENGLITVGGKNYLIKAFSNLYAQDKTAYLNEKKFKHLTSDTTFKDWSSRYLDVFGNNSMIAICTLITSFYSDEIFRLVHGELPILNLFGPKGTGKTQIADSLLAFFGEKQPINNLSKVTIYGLSQTLKSFYNSICLIDEYKNVLDMRFIEMLKSIYNRQAKIQGSFSQQGTKTEHIPINQMAILCGQDLPTLDVALLERCLCLTAFKSDYTDDQLTRYSELKTIEEKGLTHLTDDFLKFRELVLKNFLASNVLIQKLISERCPGVSVRLQKNLTTILTVFHVLEDKFEFPFNFDQVLNFGISIIEEQQKFIESSDDLKNFWSIFSTLIEQDRIKEGRNYILHDICNIRYCGDESLTHYPRGMLCLFLRWDGLYPMYAEYSRRSNMVALGEKTIQFYLEKTKYYQGKFKNKKFRDKVTGQEWVNQAYCFDYSKMTSIINLISSKTIEMGNVDMTPNLDNPDVQEIIANAKEDEEFKKAQDELPF
jgi:DNA primase